MPSGGKRKGAGRKLAAWRQGLVAAFPRLLIAIVSTLPICAVHGGNKMDLQFENGWKIHNATDEMASLQTVFCRREEFGSNPVYRVAAAVDGFKAREICKNEKNKHPEYLFFWVNSNAGFYQDAVPYSELTA
jgi:hypothetical protein